MPAPSQIPAKSGSLYRCHWDSCNQIFASRPGLADHVLSHLPQLCYTCPFCPSQATDSENLLIHIQTAHRDGGDVGGRGPAGRATATPQKRKLIVVEIDDDDDNADVDGTPSPAPAKKRRGKPSRDITGTNEDNAPSSVPAKRWSGRLSRKATAKRREDVSDSDAHADAPSPIPVKQRPGRPRRDVIPAKEYINKTWIYCQHCDYKRRNKGPMVDGDLKAHMAFEHPEILKKQKKQKKQKMTDMNMVTAAGSGTGMFDSGVRANAVEQNEQIELPFLGMEVNDFWDPEFLLSGKGLDRFLQGESSVAVDREFSPGFFETIDPALLVQDAAVDNN